MKKEQNGVKVSVCTLSYNHSKYIEDFLEGVLMQKTSFKFEVIINDDCSDDGTIEILSEYQRKYPDIIKPIFHDKNLYSLGQRHFLSRFVFPIAKGEYIALCEGDDYWTDSTKLEKQVTFLDSHQEFSMCFHNAIEHWEDHSKPDRPFSVIDDREFSGKEIFEKWIIPTASVLMRKCVIESEYYHTLCQSNRFCFRDIIMFIACAHEGKLYGMSDTMSVYRRHSDSTFFNTASLKVFYHNLEVHDIIGGDYKEIARRNCFILALKICKRDVPTTQKIKLFLTCFRLSPLKAIWRFIFKSDII